MFWAERCWRRHRTGNLAPGRPRGRHLRPSFSHRTDSVTTRPKAQHAREYGSADPQMGCPQAPGQGLHTTPRRGRPCHGDGKPDCPGGCPSPPATKDAASVYLCCPGRAPGSKDLPAGSAGSGYQPPPRLPLLQSFPPGPRARSAWRSWEPELMPPRPGSSGRRRRLEAGVPDQESAGLGPSGASSVTVGGGPPRLPPRLWPCRSLPILGLLQRPPWEHSYPLCLLFL